MAAIADGDTTSEDVPKPDRDDVVALDSAQVRRLAHPLRVRLLGSLRLHGPATSSHLAVRLGTNSGATSYHLRQLADVGLVEDAPELGQGRERYWRASHAFSSWSVAAFDDDPEARAAVAWLLGQHERETSAWRAAWAEAHDDADRVWRDAATGSDILLELTPGQLRRLMRELTDLVHEYRDAGPEAVDEGGDEARPVMVLLEGFPFVGASW